MKKVFISMLLTILTAGFAAYADTSTSSDLHEYNCEILTSNGDAIILGKGGILANDAKAAVAIFALFVEQEANFGQNLIIKNIVTSDKGYTSRLRCSSH